MEIRVNIRDKFFFPDFLINNKDRIAQMILTPVIKMDLEETDTLPETVRGEGRFGSSGMK